MNQQEIINIIDIFAPLGEGYQMTNREAIEIIQERIDFANKEFLEKHVSEYVEALKLAVKALEQTEWIPITYRDADEDEQEDGAIYMLTCPLPEEGEEVLVSSGKYIRIDTMCYDKGWYFDSYGDIRDVDAWIPLPKPYRSE